MRHLNAGLGADSGPVFPAHLGLHGLNLAAQGLCRLGRPAQAEASPSAPQISTDGRNTRHSIRCRFRLWATPFSVAQRINPRALPMRSVTWLQGSMQAAVAQAQAPAQGPGVGRPLARSARLAPPVLPGDDHRVASHGPARLHACSRIQPASPEVPRHRTAPRTTPALRPKGWRTPGSTYGWGSPGRRSSAQTGLVVSRFPHQVVLLDVGAQRSFGDGAL